jgi:hypothetical protein
MKKHEQGISLTELLVIVAFLSVLVAVFIPQFAVSSVRANNAAALADLQNAVAAEESLYVAYGGYGASAFSSSLMVAYYAVFSGGIELAGPIPAATDTTAGGILAMGPVYDYPVLLLPVVGIGIQVSSGVRMRVDAKSWPYGSRLFGYGSTYNIMAWYGGSDTVYGAEAEAKNSIYVCKNSFFTYGVPGSIPSMIAVATEGLDINGSSCNGYPLPNWALLL